MKLKATTMSINKVITNVHKISKLDGTWITSHLDAGSHRAAKPCTHVMVLHEAFEVPTLWFDSQRVLDQLLAESPEELAPLIQFIKMVLPMPGQIFVLTPEKVKALLQRGKTEEPALSNYLADPLHLPSGEKLHLSGSFEERVSIDVQAEINFALWDQRFNLHISRWIADFSRLMLMRDPSNCPQDAERHTVEMWATYIDLPATLGADEEDLFMVQLYRPNGKPQGNPFPAVVVGGRLSTRSVSVVGYDSHTVTASFVPVRRPVHPGGFLADLHWDTAPKLPVPFDIAIAATG